MKRIIVSAMTAAVVFGFSAGLAGCGTATQSNHSNTIQSASVEPGDSSVNISVVGYRLGRGSWDVNTSTETGDLVRLPRSAEGSRLRSSPDEQFRRQGVHLAG